MLDLGTDRWHLDQIAVDPAHCGRGAGAALLAALHEEVARRGGRQVTLMTYADVPWNGPRYARHGYAVLDPPPDHLQRFRETEERLGLGRYGRRVAMARHLAAPRGA